jgi:ubiquinone/menaquinone biosynthesis C-methylase UbiE
MRIRIPARDHVAPTSADDPALYYYTRALRYPYLKRLRMALRLLEGRHFGRLLEIGYGCGIFFPELRRRCGELVGVDLHRRAPAVRRMLEQEGLEAGLGVADALHLPFAANAFDGIVCLSVLEFVEDTPAALDEMLRVLRPGGLAVLGAPVLNRITGLAYERVIGHLRHREQHKAGHRRILETARSRFQELRVERFLGWVPIDYAFFFCAAGEKARAN